MFATVWKVPGYKGVFLFVFFSKDLLVKAFPILWNIFRRKEIYFYLDSFLIFWYRALKTSLLS